jgi:serine/threonine protein kinase/predicted ATPase
MSVSNLGQAMVEKTVNEELTGRIIDRKYKLVSQLGEGGMAVVYLAQRMRIGDDVAVKVLRSEIMLDLVSQARFEREAQAAARIKHPNIVTIHDFGTTDDGLTYLVMELLNGPTLESELQARGTLPVDRAINILLPVCNAISAAHQEGIIHRDLKPSNILLHRLKDGMEVIKVVDFGIVKIGQTKERLTQVNNILGTPHYMSPEQCYGRDLDPRSDVYALGVIAYETLTGRLPFDKPTLLEIMEAQVKEPPPPLRRIRPEIPPQLEAVVLRALSKQPDQRPSTATAFAHEMMAAVGTQFSASSAVPIAVKARTAEIKVSSILSTSGSSLSLTQADLRLRETITRRPAKPMADFNQFVGRQREMERLTNEFNQLLSSKARPVAILGEQGVGLSRLGEEFKLWARRQGADALLTRFYETAAPGQLPFQTWLDLIRRVIGVQRKNITSEAVLGEMISDRTGVDMPQNLFENRVLNEGEKWRAFEVISSILLRTLGEKSGVLIFDDLQYADGLSLELLSYLLRNCRSRMLFVFLARSDEATRKGHRCQEWLAALSRSGGYEAMRLQPLTEQEVRSLLDLIFGRIQIVERDIEQLRTVSQGNPYYVCEIVRLLLNEGKITLKDDQWHCENIEDFTLPESLQQLADMKLTRLDDSLKELLSQAAVIGRQFSFSLLERVSDMDEDDLADGLEKVIKLDIIDESEKRNEEYIFHDPTLHMVLYENVPRRKRRKLHMEVAKAIEAEAGNNPKKLAAQSARLLYHYHEAGQNEKTFHYGRSAAEAARSRMALAEAETYYDWALEAATEVSEEGSTPEATEWAELHLGSAEVALHLGQLDKAESALIEANKLAKAAESLTMIGRVQLVRSQIEFSRSAFDAALKAAEAGLGAAQKAGDSNLEGHLLMMLARIFYALGRFEEALDALECNLDIARQLGDRSTESQVLSLLGRMIGFAGDTKQGLTFVEEALKVARSQKDRLGELTALLRLSQIYLQTGQLDRAIEACEVGLELARTLESRLIEGTFQNGLGDVYRSMGEMELARDCYQRYFEIAQSVGNRSGEVVANHSLGLIALELGILPDAVRRLKEALLEHERLGELRLLAEAQCGLAQAYEQLGQLDEAQDAYNCSLDYCERIGYPHFEWQARYGLANCLLSLGGTEIAREQLEAAVEIIEGLRGALPSGINMEDFMRDKSKVFALLEEINNE